MALLEDPTIQRILNEVNKAASGGVFGLAGNYISESPKPMTQINMPKVNNFYTHQQQTPLFYPPPDMFGIDGISNFDQNLDLNSLESIVPIATPNNFDLYSSGFYNTMPQNIMSPYENYKNDILNTTNNTNNNNNNNNNNNKTKPIRRASSVSSTNNDILLDHHRHQEYPTIPPKLTSAMPNLGLNLRTTPQLDSIPVNVGETIDEGISNETTDIATASIDLLADKDDNNSLPPNSNNDEIDPPPHISSAGRIFYDPNPQIIQRKGSNSVTYKQNIIVRFLQPPPIPNAGPLVIKEISPQQQPPLPPLVIKQRPTPPKTPPPLVIREKPPPLPPTLATKVITRHLPPDPTPPRAVIIERLPPLPPKPRDIIIERWLPYEIVNQKRKVIVEHVQKPSKEYPQPKNVIITYEPVHAKIERHFQKQSVIREDPQAYTNRFGEQLVEPAVVIEQARAAGVLEDLDPPVSFLTSTTHSVAIGTDYETTIKTTAEHEPEQINNKDQQEEKEILPTSIENMQDDDVFVEENVTPFYMNSGESLQQTLHRLGIEIPKNILNEHQF
ncbi:unnamed protein product [Rotaria sordida]|uniref:Uncharacterized protein n=1 Tax=Rotaria sordida TaxID=392033 RepID=A0A814R847_9BILA|nr:unnamed protein product [Rotaria sordida]CAF1128980.1 unnamed protein product [Rotaria sordida]CAF1225713.1 unnamed protein product [Rotaria sordida]CAF1247659.1 unnamed protein product [Rotaria sordida]CAF4034322.1 unnamed protein product [Rotaria sordida]